MTKTVAAEVARRGVTVNAVAPGLIETDMTEGLAERLAGAGARPPAPAPRTRSPRACASWRPTAPAYVTGVVPHRRRRPDRLTRKENERNVNNSYT